MGKWALGATTLGIGIVALALAIIPTILFDVPPPWNAAGPKPVQPKVEGEKSVAFHGVKVAWGGKTVKEQPAADDIHLTRPKAFAIATAVVALFGMGLGPLASWRERQYALAVPGMSFCCLALTWQYVILGIVAGATAAAFLVVLNMLGGLGST
jgi:hypothetical protein